MSNKKILIIDDDPEILESVGKVLKSEGFKVITAVNGDEGIGKFKKENPDLVLCDMMMEKIDTGSKVAETIKKANKDIPVYLMSSIGDATTSNIDAGSLGFNGVLQKPVDPETLISSVKKILGK